MKIQVFAMLFICSELIAKLVRKLLVRLAVASTLVLFSVWIVSSSHAATPTTNYAATSNYVTTAKYFGTATTTADVGGDNSQAAYIGTGGLLLPGSFSGSSTSKSAVANCLGCTWKYTIYCMQGSDTPCKHAVTSCPSGSLLYRVWFGRSADAMRVVGSVCWGNSQPVTRRQVEGRVADYVIRYVPALSPGFAPSGGTLTSVPVIFWTGQPVTFRPPSFSLSGHTITITATPTWRWSWGDGTAVWKKVPGAQYPSRQLTHQYRISGNFNASVTTVWSARYSVSEVGTFDVSGEVIRQNEDLIVPVRSARTVLVSRQ